MAELTPTYIDATNLKALALLALVGAGAYVVVGGLPVVAGSLVIALVLTADHRARNRAVQLHRANVLREG